MFKHVVDLALKKLANPEILAVAMTHDDLVIYFDSLLVDYAKLNYGISCEEFKASLAKYEILRDPTLKSILDSIVTKIQEILPSLQTNLEETNA